MKNEIVLFEDGELQLEVNVKDEMVWLTQAQMTQLFEVDRTGITRHLTNVLKDGELSKKEVCAKFAHTASDGKTY